MTLARKMTLMMILALTTLFICTFVLTVNHAKTYFEEQLQQKAQDTATALGLSVSHQQNNDKPDLTMIHSTIDAVFDHGYFSSIWVQDIKGNILIKKYLKTPMKEAPNWFMKLIPIQNKVGNALIMNGWSQKGEIFVESDNSTAYFALWHTAKKLFFLFLCTTLLVIGASLLLINLMFKPLKQIVKQAEDIGKKNLYQTQKLPKSKELRELATTMNAMVTKLQLFFSLQVEELERLRAKIYQDSLTGKGNRRYFFQQFTQFLNDENYFLPSYLFLIELTGLAEFNNHEGYQQGDQVILEISNVLEKLFQDKQVFLFSHLDGPSFAIVIIETHMQAIEQLMADVSQKTQSYVQTRDKVLSCYVSAIKCEFGEPPANLLNLADKNIKKAAAQGKMACLDQETFQATDVKLWQQKIETALQAKDFCYYFQPVKSSEIIYHKECFVKLITDSKEISASLFFPLINQLALGNQLDQMVLQEIAYIKQETPVAINLSSCTITEENKQKQFLSLLRSLNHNNKIKLHFEFSEFIFAKYSNLAKSFIDSLVALGHRVGIDRVGSTLTPLNYLKTIDITYLKLDGSLSKNVDENKLKQEIITHWVTTAQRLDIILIATAVESESQWRSLKQLGIVYFQGNYIQSPSLIKTK